MYNQMPTIGSEIAVTTRFKEGYYQSTNKFRDTEYHGTVLRPPFNLNPNEFALGDKTAFNGFRIINLAYVVNINMISGTSKEVKEQEKAIHYLIEGSKGNEYTVTQEHGKWSCTCSGFQFRRRCKHIDSVSK